MAHISIHVTIDTRQLQRELRMLTGAQKADLQMRMERDEKVMWSDSFHDGRATIVTHRLCHG